jgi:xanthine dehydrogenase YagR molybdenum-binding subunit
MVIAETLEDATFAASLVETEYQKDSFEVDFNSAKEKLF